MRNSKKDFQQSVTQRLTNGSGKVITSFHNGAHDSEVVPSQWILPKKSQKPRLLGLPMSAFLILAMEFMERLSYMMVLILSFQYCTDMLELESATANSIMNGINFWSLGCSLIFAFLSDAYWGKAKTILVSVIFYLMSLTILCITSSPVGYGDFPHEPRSAFWGFFVFFVLVGLGTGGVKVCVGPFTAEQVALSDGEQVTKCYHILYWFINFGSMIGVTAAPYLTHFGESKEGDKGSSYYVPFSIACGSFYIAFIAYIAGWNYYTHRVPSKSIFTDVYNIIRSAIRNRKMSYGEAADQRVKERQLSGDEAQSERGDSKPEFRISALSTTPSDIEKTTFSAGGETVYDPANNNYNLDEEEKKNIQEQKPVIDVSAESHAQSDKPLEFNFDQEKHWLYKATGHSYTEIKAVRQVFRLLPFCLYFSYYSLMYSCMWQLIQMADWLDKPSGVQNTSLSVTQPFFVLALIPFNIYYLYPTLRNKLGIKLTHVTRMMWGFFIMALAILFCLMLQLLILREGTVNADGDFIGTGDYKGKTHSSVSFFWLTVVYFLIAVSEVFAKTTFFAFCYTQAPKSMVSAVMTLYTISDAGGSLLGIILHSMFVPDMYVYTFAIFPGIMLLIVMPIFYWHLKHYNSQGVYGGETVETARIAAPKMYFSQESTA
eukprot:Nk52_evm3s356 gene=Nk52_evmTU3s356